MNDNVKKSDASTDTKRAWAKPKINSNVPVNRTRSSNFAVPNGEDGFYQS